MTDAHARFSALLPAYIAEVLSDDDRAWVEQHMAECEECSALHTRLLMRLPLLRDPEGHAPVSVLEDLARPDSPLTALERQLVLQHLMTCAACTAEARALGHHALISRSPLSAWLVRGGLAAAAALVLVLAIRRDVPVPPPVPSPIEEQVPAPTVRPNTARLVLAEQTRGVNAPMGVAFVDSNTQTLAVTLPTIFLSDSNTVTISVLTSSGVVVSRRSLSPSAIALPIPLDSDAGPWKPGRYRLELKLAGSSDASIVRRYEFELRAQSP